MLNLKTKQKTNTMPGGGGTRLKPSTLEAVASRSLELEASLLYPASSRTTKATQGNLISKRQKEKKIQTNKIMLNLVKGTPKFSKH